MTENKQTGASGDDSIRLHFTVVPGDLSIAGEASSGVKKVLKQLGIRPDVVRRAGISMYEAEINMVIHAEGGVVDAEITPAKLTIVLKDKGPGIRDIELAMQEGYSTAPDHIREMGFGAGMGLPNIKRHADTLLIDTEQDVGTTVTIIFNL